MNRRRFIKKLGGYSSAMLVGGYALDSLFGDQTEAAVTSTDFVYLARNGTPSENVAKVIEMRFGGIEHFIEADDVVVINPNGQWTNQGGTNCACLMGLIDLILNRPGGFDGEILVVENTQFQIDGYWTADAAGLVRNGPYNFLDMIAHYQNSGRSNVTGVRLMRNMDDPDNWPMVSGPTDGQGWIRPEWRSPTTDCWFYLPYPIIRSAYSGRLLDLKNGVYDGGYAGQPGLKFIKMPNLNNHGWDAQQDYAGITSTVKSFLGIAELENDYRGPFNDGHYNMHTYNQVCHGSLPAQRAYSAGEAVGAWMNLCRKPNLCITTAEWVGWESRTGTGAENAKTVGLCENPVSLDYYMSKYVLWPTHAEQQYFNPDFDTANNMTRKTLEGCLSMGYGTLDEAAISAFVYDFDAPKVFRFEIDRTILKFRNGEATEQEVLDLIEQYNAGGK